MIDRTLGKPLNSPSESEDSGSGHGPADAWGRLLAGASFAGLVVLLLVSRFAALDYRAFHHDESIHAQKSWQVANKGAGEYDYDPVYHGPFLYHFGAIFHKFLPDTDYTARAPYAVAGLLLALVFRLWRDILGRGTVLLVMAFLILSPTVNYFSRFARHDVYQTAWLAAMIVWGVVYLRTARVRHLTAVAVILALSYCTKEDFYVNYFAPCSFLVAWAVVRFIRSPRKALEDVFIRYLPLTRFLIVLACFSVFVFAYVAIDCRVSPETGLIRGVARIAAHSTSIVERTSEEEFKGESGYFTAAGRQESRAAYLRIAFAAPICLLLLAEGLSLYLERRRTLASLVLTACLILLFYVLTAYYFVSLAQWVKEVKVEDFLPELTRTLTVRALLLGLVAALFVLPDFMFPTHREAPSPAPDGEEGPEDVEGREQTRAHGHAGGIGEAFSLWKPRLFGFWGFILQIMCAAALYLLLFCSLGTNARVGSSAGLYRYLEYWFRHQTGEFRIWGAWWYYLPRLVLYEAFPLVLVVLLLSFFVLERLAGKIRAQPAKSRTQERRAKKSPRERRKGRGGDERRESRAGTPSVDSREAADRPSGSFFWRPVPLPLLCLSAYLVVYTIGIYAILNEKVPWLLIYQAFAVSLFAALLAGHWLAVHPRVRDAAAGWLVDRIAAGGGPRTRASSRPQANPGVLLFGISVAGLAVFGVLYTAGQHVCAVFVRPDAPSELLVYTQTTHEFAEEMGEIRRRQEKAIADGKPLKIAVEGTSEWPCAWYLRNCEVRWKTVDPAGDIQILDDSLENRRKLERRRGKAWEMEPFDLRGWWFWHGDTKGLPGGNDFSENLRAFLLNSPNDRRDAFAGDAWPRNRRYPLGFAEQIRRYVFGRTIWYPTGGQKVLVCYKTSEDIPAAKFEGVLKGADSTPQMVPAQASFGMKGSDKGQFDQPRGLTFTPDGNIAVVDSKNGRVQVISPEGEFLLEFGKEYLNAEYSGPCDVACDREGNFYVADTWNHAVRKASPKGQLLKTAKEALQDGGPTGLFGPRGIALSSEGKVYVTDTGHKYVRVYDGDLNPLFSWGGGGEATGLFSEPVGIAIDSQDRVFVADTGNGRIQQFSAKGDFQAEYQTALPGANELIVMEPHLEALPDGRLVQTVSTKGAIWFVNPEAKTAVILRVVQPAIGEPLGVAVGPGGALWISDRKSGVIARVQFQK